MKKMPKSKNGPRSNFSFLPFDLRFRIIGMIQDGCTASVIAADPEVVKAFDALGSSFNRATMTRIKKSKEYRDWSNQRRQEKESFDADRLTSAILKENASLDTISEQTKVALLKALSDLSNLAELSDENRIKALRSITQSVTLLSSQAKDNRIDSLNRKLREKDEVIADKDAQIAKLKTEIERLTTKDNTVADPAKVADELSNLLGVKK